MVQKLGKALLALSVMVPMQVRSSKQCETLCNLIITKCLRVRGNEVVDGNLTVNGTLTAGGVNVSALAGLATTLAASGATGVPGTGGLGTLVASVIPYSSGYGVASALPLTLAAGLPTTSSIFLAFGDNFLTTAALVDPTLTTTFGSFSYIIPRAGTLSNLWGSIDANFQTAGAGTGPFPFVYTIWHSSAVNGATTPYTATALTATATLTSQAAGNNILRTAFGSSTTSLAVAAGDRITLVITNPTVAVPAGAITLTAFQAGVTYIPS